MEHRLELWEMLGRGFYGKSTAVIEDGIIRVQLGALWHGLKRKPTGRVWGVSAWFQEPGQLDAVFFFVFCYCFFFLEGEGRPIVGATRGLTVGDGRDAY